MKIVNIEILDAANFIGCAFLEDSNGDSMGTIPACLKRLDGSREMNTNPDSYQVVDVPIGNGDTKWLCVTKP